MTLVRPLPILLVALVGLQLHAAPPLELHRGSTRDWVRRSGPNADSVRYRLQFLDSTYHDTTFYTTYADSDFASTTVVTRESWYDWRVRITLPDSPSVEDTAVLRVLSTKRDPNPYNASDKGYDIRQLAFWAIPSDHFPIDVQSNPQEQVRALTYFGEVRYYTLLPYTGAWEMALNWNCTNCGISVGDMDGDLYYSQLWVGYWHSVPTVTTKDSVGITSWMSNGNIWTLTASDGTPLPKVRRGLNHTLRKGESWVYKDSSRKEFGTLDNAPPALISLELLDTPSDSAGWTCLSVRETTAPDTGKRTDSALEIRLDTLRQIVRVLKGSKEDVGTPWSVPSTMEGKWALGLLTHPLFPDSENTRYGEVSGERQGEMDYTTRQDSHEMHIQKDIGSTRIFESHTTNSFPVYNSRYTWTFVAHSLDNSILSTSSGMLRQARDLAWLWERLSGNPDIEVVRFGLDGSSLRGRGTEALKLLDMRGVGVVQVQDGQEIVRLRVLRP